MDTSSIQVHLRMRPCDVPDDTHCLVRDAESENSVVLLPVDFIGMSRGAESYNYDTVHDTQASQESIFESAVSHQLGSLFHGINVSVLCYGMTGSGKTHTTIGGAGKDEGIIPRAAKWIFDKIEDIRDSEPETARTEFRCSVQIIEVYNVSYCAA
jgi:kinesin family protein 22